MNPLQSQLAALRRRFRFVTLVRGVSFVVVVLLGGALLAGLLDWTVHLPAALRAVLLMLTLSGTFIAAYRFLLAPLAARTDDLALALRVEEEYPVLNDSLASTVQFLQQPEEASAGSSPILRKEAIQRAIRLAQSCDFNKVVDTRALRLSGLMAAGILAVGLLLSLSHPATVRSAMLRLAHPFGEHEWATATQLHLDEFPKRVAIGQRFQISGSVTGEIPEAATIVLKGYSIGDDQPREYPIKKSDGGKGKFVAKLDLTEQYSDFHFYVQVNDARSPRRQERWHTIEVAQPPRLIPVDGAPPPQKIKLEFPEYTELASPKILPAGTKHIDAVEGTLITMEAAADRPLNRAWIRYVPFDADEPQASSILQATKLRVLGLAHPLQALTTHILSEQAWAKFPVKIDESGLKLYAHFRPWLSGTHVLHIEDEDGLPNNYTFNIQLLADPSPTVQLAQPATSRSLLPDAELTLEIIARDETYGLKSVFVEHWRKNQDGHVLDFQARRLPLFSGQLLAEGKAAGATLLDDNPIPEPQQGRKLRLEGVKVVRRISLNGLVQEGDILVIRAGADDFNDVVAFNTPGYSHEVELYIVGKTEFNAVLDKAQADVQKQLNDVKQWQKEALKKVEEVEKNLDENGKLTEEDITKLQESGELQKQIKEEIGLTKKDSLMDKLNKLDEVLKDNKKDPSGAKDRVDLLKHQLKELVLDHLQKIGPNLSKAEQKLHPIQNPEPNEDDKQNLADAKNDQQAALQTLDELLKHLDRWASLQQIRQEAQELLKAQQDVKSDTEKLIAGANLNATEWHAKIDRLADKQLGLAQDAKRLLDKLAEVGREKKEKTPEIAQMVEEAMQLGLELQLVDEMKLADSRLRKKLPGKAAKTQRVVVHVLEQMIDALTESREEELERLIQKQQAAQKELKEFAEKLEKLQQKTEEAKKIADPEKQKEALQKLADEQKQLEEQAKKKARELDRLRAEQAGEALEKAAQELEKGRQKLNDGQDPQQEQQQAQKELEKAKKELEKAIREAEDELARERLARIADQIKGLLERQEAAIAETERFHKLILQAGWQRDFQIDRYHDSEAQTTLGKETAGLAEKLKGAKVFALILRKAGGNMESAAQAMKTRWESAADLIGLAPLPKDRVDSETQAKKKTLQLQRLAAQRLKALVDAAKPPPPKTAQKPKQNGGEPQQQDKKGGLKAQDGIPPMAQLKALKSEQVMINKRTQAFNKEYTNINDLPPEAQAELKSIHDDQEAIFEIFQGIAAAANNAGIDDKGEQ